MRTMRATLRIAIAHTRTSDHECSEPTTSSACCRTPPAREMSRWAWRSRVSPFFHKCQGNSLVLGRVAHVSRIVWNRAARAALIQGTLNGLANGRNFCCRYATFAPGDAGCPANCDDIGSHASCSFEAFASERPGDCDSKSQWSQSSAELLEQIGFPMYEQVSASLTPGVD